MKLEMSKQQLQWVVVIGVREVIMSKSIDICSIFRAGCEEKGDLVIEVADEEVAGTELHVLKLELSRLGRPPRQHPSRNKIKYVNR